jgi:hypothetical protein
VSVSLFGLRPEFHDMVDEWLSDCTHWNIEILITCATRSGATQDALYAIGRTVPGKDVIPLIRPMGRIVTNAQAGQSAHQYGMAIDFVPMNSGKPDWSGTGYLWNKAIELAEAAGMQSLRPMESAHLQHPKWKLLKDQQNA